MRYTGFLALGFLAYSAQANPPTSISQNDPFQVIDPQKWVNPDAMTWEDYKPPPNTKWNDPKKKGSVRNFNIALVTLDYPDLPFAVTQPAGSTIFSNPQPVAANIPRDKVPSFYRDFLNTPNELNKGHTLHEYWMEDSGGKYGVDLTVFGAYKMPAKSWQYGIDNRFNPGACPKKGACDVDLRTDGLGAWRKDIGEDQAKSYELVFILSAGQDESGTWQEFGNMKWADKEDVPDAFGPPQEGNQPLNNYASTRYVGWTSWASAASIWPNAGGGSSTQAESSGMAVYAHELSHLLRISDNYNNPYGEPMRRAYTGPWSMMSRGSFNGPGGPHTRWEIPAVNGASMGSLHTIRDKYQLGLMDKSGLLRLSNEGLAESGLVVARITARAVVSKLMGVRIEIQKDLSPPCDINKDVLCDGGGYNNYEIEVIDRMGSDSFQPDSGVMISKSKNADQGPFQWTIDANPKDIKIVDFKRPDGKDVMVTMGDYRQLADALFHAGTRSGSQFEYVDRGNSLHIYVLNINRDEKEVLSYDVAVRSLKSPSGKSKYGVSLSAGKPITDGGNTPTGKGVFCTFDLKNTGTYVKGGQHPQDVSAFVGSDVYRLSAEVASGEGWKVEVPNALVAAKMGETVSAKVAVGAGGDAAGEGVVRLMVTSESDGRVKATADCKVTKA